MTLSPRAQLPTLALSLALIGASVLEVAAATIAGELPIANGAARRAAHTLRFDRRARWRERLPALGASTTHPRIVPPATRLLGLPAEWISIAPRPAPDQTPRWITIPPTSGSALGRR